MKYFAPLSSFKAKHKKLSDSIVFVKIGDMAVINLNNMFPVADGMYSLKNIKIESDFQYRTLLNNEYRIVKQKADMILANAKMLYEKVTKNRTSKLAKRCNNFKVLEEKCKLYVKNWGDSEKAFVLEGTDWGYRQPDKLGGVRAVRADSGRNWSNWKFLIVVL